MSENIAVIGSGYVGLVTASCMAEVGNKVNVYDIDKEKIHQLQNSKAPFYEPKLSKLISNNLNKNLNFSLDIQTTLKNVSACFIAVGTPHDEITNTPNLSFFYQAIDKVIENISNDILIINKSTLPLGTAKKIQEYISTKKTKHQVSIATNPEFLSQGRAVDDFMSPQRIVVGVEQEKDYELLEKIYKFFIKREKVPFIKTNIATAELIKYTANSFLAMKVAFINEVAEIASNIGANIEDISYAIGLDNRIGNKFLNPGPGYGGSCFPKDTKALSITSKSLGLDLPLIQNINLSNEKNIKSIADKIIAIITEKNLKEIAILGIAFKAGTEDIRDAQAIKIINYLLDKIPSTKIHIHDPLAIKVASEIFKNSNISVIDNLSQTKGISLFCIVTEWDDYSDLDTKLSKDQIIIDLRNIIKKAKYPKNYYAIGKNL